MQTMSTMRKDDTDNKTYFRSEERIFQMNGTWWFAVRKKDRGPYPTRKAAQDGLTQHVLDVRGNIELNEISRLNKRVKEPSGWDITSN